MLRRFTTFAFAALTLLSACDSKSAASHAGAYTLVFLKTGPKSGQLAEAENKTAFEGHFSNMERLALEHKLLVAGPYGKTRHDSALRGLFVLDTAVMDEARAWGQTDPPTLAGVFVQEYHALKTDAPLLAALQSDLALREVAKAEGRTPQPGEGARSYVLLTAEEGELARRELTALGPTGGVYLIANLDGTRCFALLDAADVAAAQEKFGALLDRIGTHDLDDWFASAQLARLPELAAH